MIQSQPITPNHDHRPQEVSSLEQDSSYLNMTIMYPPQPRAINVISSNSLSKGDSPADIEDVDREVLNYLASNPCKLDLLASNFRLGSAMASNQIDGQSHAALSTALESFASSSPDLYSASFPNGPCKELHSQFHDRMAKTASHMALTRLGTPESSPDPLPESTPQIPLSHLREQASPPNSSDG
jgi:hypothetical protein